MRVFSNNSLYGTRTEPVAILNSFDSIRQHDNRNLQDYLNLERHSNMEQSYHRDLENYSSSPIIDPDQKDSIYKTQWIQLFEAIPYNPETELIVCGNRLRDAALNGDLQNSPFRSLCWRFYLGLLPRDMNEWRNTLIVDRKRFLQLIEQLDHVTRDSEFEDHPLSKEQSSLWRQHFSSLDVRRTIEQDVQRTFPNESYFRDPEVQAMMTDLLECYTIESGNEYKQGMHEVLAPICYVFRQDFLAFQQACETDQLSSTCQQLLSIIFDPSYFEADVYIVFEKIMQHIHPWYHYEECESRTQDFFMTAPLSPSSQRTSLTNPGITFIDNIHCRLLLKTDRMLYLHFKQTEIDPALFGLRWIRLLFGHEFLLYDLLHLWDCIFAIGDNFALVPYVYVAMLLQIRPDLMSGDCSDCLSTLMRCPSEVAVEQLIKRALNLYDPVKYPPIPPKEAAQRSSRYDNSKSKYRRSNGTASLSSKLSGRSQSLVRRMTMFDFNRSKHLESKSKSSHNLILPNLGRDLAQSIISALSGRTTPSNSVNNSAMPTPTPVRRSLGTPMTAQEKIDQIYRRCVQALDLCAAHVDVTMCRLREGDEECRTNGVTAVLKDSPNGISRIEHLKLAKVQISHVRDLLDGLTSVCDTDIPKSKPLTTNTPLIREPGSPSEWIFSSTESSIGFCSPWGDRFSVDDKEEQQGSVNGEDQNNATNDLHPPGSIIRMEPLGEYKKKRSRKPKKNKEKNVESTALVQ